MRWLIMALENAVRFIDGLRPCKRTVEAIEQNAVASRELSGSIAKLTETLTDHRTLQRRATDPDDDESWRQRRSVRR